MKNVIYTGDIVGAVVEGVHLGKVGTKAPTTVWLKPTKSDDVVCFKTWKRSKIEKFHLKEGEVIEFSNTRSTPVYPKMKKYNPGYKSKFELTGDDPVLHSRREGSVEETVVNDEVLEQLRKQGMVVVAAKVKNCGDVVDTDSIWDDGGKEVKKLECELEFPDGSEHHLRVYGEEFIKLVMKHFKEESGLVLKMVYVTTDGSLSVSLHKDGSHIPEILDLTEAQWLDLKKRDRKKKKKNDVSKSELGSSFEDELKKMNKAELLKAMLSIMKAA